MAGTVPIKTAEGQAELNQRSRRVSQRHRTVLFLIDGKRSAADVRSMALQAGVPESCFGDLLEMGLITLPEVSVAPPSAAPEMAADVFHVDLPLADDGSGAKPIGPEGIGAMLDSILPPSRTLQPESVSADSGISSPPLPDSWLMSDLDANRDTALAEARIILLRAVRAEAPLAGSLTLLKLKRARTRAELSSLLGEVEARITKPHRTLAAAQTMRRVRQLLDGRIDVAAPPATSIQA